MTSNISNTKHVQRTTCLYTSQRVKPERKAPKSIGRTLSKWWRCLLPLPLTPPTYSVVAPRKRPEKRCVNKSGRFARSAPEGFRFPSVNHEGSSCEFLSGRCGLHESRSDWVPPTQIRRPTNPRERLRVMAG